jgi:hypothetical protein
MQRKIASFSSSPKELAAKPLPKGEQQYSFRQFTYDPTQLAGHRDDRCFCSKQIWIQGLPTDLIQAMDIIKHIGNEMKLTISIIMVGELFTALNGKSFLRSPPTRRYLAQVLQTRANMVLELVIRTSNHTHQESVMTIVFLPWLINVSSDLTTIMHFI